MATMPTHVGAK